MSIAQDPLQAKLEELFGQSEPSAPYTLLTSDQPLSKRFGKANGEPVKLGSDAPLVSGKATRRTLDGTADEMLGQLAAELPRLGPRNAIICAPPPAGRAQWPITTRAQAEGRTDVIARTKEHFLPTEGPALMGMDFDTRDYVEPIQNRLIEMGRNNLSRVLADIYPPFAEAASVSRASMSSGVMVKSTGKKTPANGGFHRFFVVNDGRLVRPFIETLRDRLMLEGWLWGLVAKNGSVLMRTLIDATASSDASRLWYEGVPLLEDDDLVVVPEDRAPTLKKGNVLNISKLAPLDEDERQVLAEKQQAIRVELDPRCRAVRVGWLKEMRGRVPKHYGSSGLAEAGRRASDEFVLSGSFPIVFDELGTVTAREVLHDPKRFHRATCADPLEPDYNGGRNIAVAFTDGYPLRIESQAHGGISYRISLAVEDVFEENDEEDSGLAAGGSTADEAGAAAFPRDLFDDGDVGAAVLAVPDGALPPVIEAWSRDVSERVGAPQAFAAIAALTTISGALGSKLRIQPKQHDTGWTEPPFLWGCIIEAPGGKKSPIIGQATSPLTRLDTARAREGSIAYAQWEERKKAAKRGQPFTEPEPKIERYVVDNFTVEALGGVLANNPSGVTVSMDELTGLIGSLDAYKPNRGGDRPMLLKLYEGRESRIDRVGRKHLHIPCWGASVIGGIQPRKITEMARDLDADGLLQRFLPVWGDGKRRDGVDRAPDAAAVEAYETAVVQLAQLNIPGARPVRLSAEAHKVWRQVGDRIATLAALPGMSDAWAGHMGKWPGLSARLLLVCHALAHIGDELHQVDAQPVSAATAEQASKLADWLLANSIRFYVQCIGAGEAGDDAKWIAGYILSSGTTGQITRRDVGQWRHEMREDPLRVGRAMRFLEHADWVTPNMSERVDKFGPSRWTICPEVHDGRFADRARGEQSRRASEREKIAAAVAERRRLLRGGE